MACISDLGLAGRSTMPRLPRRAATLTRIGVVRMSFVVDLVSLVSSSQAAGDEDAEGHANAIRCFRPAPSFAKDVGSSCICSNY